MLRLTGCDDECDHLFTMYMFYFLFDAFTRTVTEYVDSGYAYCLLVIFVIKHGDSMV